MSNKNYTLSVEVSLTDKTAETETQEQFVAFIERDKAVQGMVYKINNYFHNFLRQRKYTISKALENH